MLFVSTLILFIWTITIHEIQSLVRPYLIDTHARRRSRLRTFFGSSSCCQQPLRNRLLSSLYISIYPIPFDDESTKDFLTSLSTIIPSKIDFSSLNEIGQDVDLDTSAQILNDLSYIASDLSVYITGATSYLRFAALIGRILSLTSDYLDQDLSLEEFVFQHVMILTTFGLLLKSVAPILQSSFVKTTEFDDDAYRMLFEPIGVSWIQYKSLKATSCVDWITVDANTVLVNEHEAQKFTPSIIIDNTTLASELSHWFRDGDDDDDNKSVSTAGDTNQTNYMYWLYRGDVSVSYDGREYYDITRTRGKYIDDPEALGFLADMRFLYMMDRNRRRKRLMELRNIDKNAKMKYLSLLQDTLGSSWTSATNPAQSLKVGYSMATITVKNREAILLRVNGSKLLELMENDEPLSASVRLLLMMSLQRKIGALLRSGKEPQKNVYDLVSATDRFVFRQRTYKDDSLSPDHFS